MALLTREAELAQHVCRCVRLARDRRDGDHQRRRRHRAPAAQRVHGAVLAQLALQRLTDRLRARRVRNGDGVTRLAAVQAVCRAAVCCAAVCRVGGVPCGRCAVGTRWGMPGGSWGGSGQGVRTQCMWSAAVARRASPPCRLFAAVLSAGMRPSSWTSMSRRTSARRPDSHQLRRMRPSHSWSRSYLGATAASSSSEEEGGGEATSQRTSVPSPVINTSGTGSSPRVQWGAG